MNLRTNAKYALACLTGMGVRITPANRMAVQNSNQFYMQATSAETNVLNVASSLGHECLALTKFVEGSPVAAFIKSQLRARGIASVSDILIGNEEDFQLCLGFKGPEAGGNARVQR